MSLYIPVLCGSIRRGRNTPRLARFVERKLAERDDVRTRLLDLAELQIPLLEERMRFLEDPPAGLVSLAAEIARADALVIATPEYNKGYPAALKNAIDALGDELQRKPVGIVTHSVGAFAGTVVLQQLRAVVMNLGAVPIPAAVTVPHVEASLGEKGEALDEALEGRCERFLTQLAWYTAALKEAREPM